MDEADLDRIAVGDAATFYAEADSRIEAPLRVVEIARASTRVLSDPALASVYGGPITVRTQKQNELIPDRTLYRVTLSTDRRIAAADADAARPGDDARRGGQHRRAHLARLLRDRGPRGRPLIPLCRDLRGRVRSGTILRAAGRECNNSARSRSICRPAAWWGSNPGSAE